MSRFSSLNVCAVVASMLAVLVITTHSFGQEVVHVDGDNGSANPPGQGDDWGVDAYKYLQDALERADFLVGQPGIDTVEIWVAAMQPGDSFVECGAGAYRPDLGASVDEGDTTESFQLRDNVELYGGFPPGGGDWDDRNTVQHTTILTGEIIDPCPHSNCPGESAPECLFADVVVTAEDVGTSAILDGFTIRSAMDKGQVYGWPNRGMIITDATPIIKNCTFEGNEAADGGALQIDNGGLPTGHAAVEIRDSMFVENQSTNGGAIWLNDANVHVLNCVLRNNVANGSGGAIYVPESETELVVSHCLLESNTASGHGGAIFFGLVGGLFDTGQLRVLDSVIKLNEAYAGGGIMAQKLLNLEIANSTIVYNVATDSSSPGGVHLMGLCVDPGEYAILNSILYFNERNGVQDHDAQLLREIAVNCESIVEYSNIQGPWPPQHGYVNSHPLDPGFVDDRPHRVQLECDSPNIDVGKNDYAPLDEYNIRDLDNPDPNAVAPDFFFDNRIVDGLKDGRAVVDIGADEYQPGDVNCSCAADLNGDCVVGGADLGILLAAWGPCDDPNDCPEDLTGSGNVGGADLGTLLSAWGDCPMPRAECDTGGGTSTMSGGGDNMFYEWLIYASYDEIVDWLIMMGYWPE